MLKPKRINVSCKQMITAGTVANQEGITLRCSQSEVDKNVGTQQLKLLRSCENVVVQCVQFWDDKKAQ